MPDTFHLERGRALVRYGLDRLHGAEKALSREPDLLGYLAAAAHLLDIVEGKLDALLDFENAPELVSAPDLALDPEDKAA